MKCWLLRDPTLSKYSIVQYSEEEEKTFLETRDLATAAKSLVIYKVENNNK